MKRLLATKLLSQVARVVAGEGDEGEEEPMETSAPLGGR